MSTAEPTPPTSDQSVTGHGVLRIDGSRIPISLTVPTRPCAAEDLLPEIWRLADQITDHAAAKARRAGRTISCTKGCGACCRQMVPLSPAEARHIARVVSLLPSERAAEMRARFARAKATMAAAGVTPTGHPDDDKAAYRAYGLSYFRQGVSCPFLENESCSIHTVRPLVCREYLVTSPPAACAALGSGRVRQLPVPVRVWAAFGRSQSPDGQLHWRPLIDALDPKSTAAPSDATASQPPLTGPERAEAFLRQIQEVHHP